MMIRRRPLQRLTEQTFEKIGQRSGVVRMFRRGIPRLLLNMLRMIVVALAMLHALRHALWLRRRRRPLRVCIGLRTKQPSAELFK